MHTLYDVKDPTGWDSMSTFTSTSTFLILRNLPDAFLPQDRGHTLALKRICVVFSRVQSRVVFPCAPCTCCQADECSITTRSSLCITIRVKPFLYAMAAAPSPQGRTDSQISAPSLQRGTAGFHHWGASTPQYEQGTRGRA